MPPKDTIVCFLCKGRLSYKNDDASKFEKHMKNEHMVKFGLEYLLAGCNMSEDERLAIKDVIKEWRIEQEKVVSEEVMKEEVDKDESKRIKDEPDISVKDNDTTLEEDAEEVVSSKSKPKPNKSKLEAQAARFQCDDCPISFTQSGNLEEHISRKHKNKSNKKSKSKEILDSIDRKNGLDGEFTLKDFKTASDASKKTSIATLTPKSASKSNTAKVVVGLATKKVKNDDVPVNEETIERKSLSSTTPVPKNKKGGGASLVAEPGQDPGEGTVCPLCSKEFPKNGPMRNHFVDIHQPGEFPCKGCQKVFTSKNKMSSHYSRNCKRKTL